MAAEPGERAKLLTDRERRWLDALIVLGTIAVALVAIGLTANLVLFFGDVLIIFFLAWLLAFVLSPIAGLIVRLLPFLPRVVAVMIAYALLIVVVLGLIMLAAQMLAESIANFVASIPQIQGNLPQTLAPITDWLNRLGFQVDLVESLKTAIADLGNNLENIAQPLSQVALASFGTIGNLMIVLFLSIFMALDKDRMLAFAVRLVPPQYAEETRLLERSVGRSFGGFLRGQAIMGLLYAAVAAVTSFVFGLPYVAATTAFTGVLHAIPFFGPFVSWVPVVAVALFAMPSVFIPVTAIMVVGWLVTMNVVQPRLMADSVGIHPIVVLGSIIIGGKVAGIPGAIFGIPVAAVLSSFFFYYLNRASADSRTVAQRAARRVSEREGRPVVPPEPPSLTEVHQQADGTDVFYRGPYPPSAGQERPSTQPPGPSEGQPTNPPGPSAGYPPGENRP